MKRSFIQRIPWPYVPAATLAVYAAFRAMRLPIRTGSPFPSPAQGGYPLSAGEALLLCAAMMTIMAVMAGALRFLTRNEASRTAAGAWTLVIPVFVILLEGSLDSAKHEFLNAPFGPWTGLVAGAAACASIVYIHFIIRARFLRHGAILFLWPIAAVTALEIGINATPLGRAPVFAHFMESHSWELLEHTNLFGQFDDAKFIPLPHGEKIPIEAPEGARRLIALGSSTSCGDGLESPSRTWPGRLAEKLSPGWEVLNAGVEGYPSFQLSIYLKDVLLRLQPEIVVFYYGGSDDYGPSAKTRYIRLKSLTDGADCSGYAAPDRQTCLFDAVRYGTNNSVAMEIEKRLMRHRVFLGLRNLALRAEMDGLWSLNRNSSQHRDRPESPTSVSLDALLDMARAVGDANGRLVLVPVLQYPGKPEEDADKMMKQAAATAGGPLVIDPTVAGRWAGTQPLFSGSSRLTALGCDLLAERIFDGLKEIGLVE